MSIEQVEKFSDFTGSHDVGLAPHWTQTTMLIVIPLRNPKENEYAWIGTRNGQLVVRVGVQEFGFVQGQDEPIPNIN